MTDILLDQYAPGGVMKQLGDAAGGIIYDQDYPGGCMRQLHEASGMDEPFDQYAPGGAFGQIEEAVEAGGAPDWVPANAVIHIDFVGGDPQGRAWADGAEVAVDTLLGNDPAIDAAYAITEYNSSDLVADGYKPTGSSTHFTAFIGAARTLIMAGATLKYVTKLAAEPLSGTTAFAMTSADGNDALEFSVGIGGIYVESWNGPANSGVLGTNTAPGALDVYAFTIAGMRFEAAVNGNSEIIAVTLDPTDGIPGSVLNGASFNFRGVTVATIQSITLYDPLPSTAGLSELSEVA